MKSPQEKSSTLTLKQKQVNGAILRTTVSYVPLIYLTAVICLYNSKVPICILVTKYYICSPRGRRAFRELRSRPGPVAADQVLGRVSGQSLGEVTAIFLQYSNAKRHTATLCFGARRCGGRVNGEEEEKGGFDLEHWRSCTKREKGLVGIFSITNHSLS